MARRGLLFEIEGCTLALTLNEATVAPVQFGQTIVKALKGIPQSQNMSVNPIEGTFESAGTSLQMTREAGILQARLDTPTTTLASDLDSSSVTVTVSDTSGFPSSGYHWIDQEAIAYTGKTTSPDTFTGCTRGALGTTATTHDAEVGITATTSTRVYGYNPKIHGRKCWLYWYDLDSPASKTLRFIGYIDSIKFNGGGFTASLLNGSQRISDAECMSGAWVRGKLLGTYDQASNQELEPISSVRTLNSLFVSLDDSSYPFPSPSLRGLLFKRYFQIGDEVFRYTREDHPPESIARAVGTTGTRLYFDTDIRRYVGEYVTFTDATGASRHGLIVEEDAASALPTYPWRYYHTAAANPGAGNTVSVPNEQFITFIRRSQVGTRAADHEIGEEIKEIRVLGDDDDGLAAGNHVQCLLALLTSTGAALGGDKNGIYDTLPKDWGAGIDVDLIDLPAFESLIDYATQRRFIFTEPVKPRHLLTDLARATGSRIFWAENGKLTVNAERDLYPDSDSVSSITDADLYKGQAPDWDTATEKLYNCWIWRGNAPRGQDFKDQAFFDVPESVALHGKRSLPDLEDPGLIQTRSGDQMELVAVSILRRWSNVIPFMEIAIKMPPEGTVFRPGELIDLGISNVPDLTGSAGTSGLWEVLSYTPQDPQGKVTILLAQMPPASNTRLIAPSAEVESWSGSDVVLKASSVTYYADATNGWDSDTNNLPTGEDGKEDVDYFKEGFAIRFWDMSTLGGAGATTAAASITSIDYTTKTLTVSAVPAWLAAGDLVRLDQYDDVKAATDPSPIDWYMCLADETNTPPDLYGDSAHEWGG